MEHRKSRQRERVLAILRETTSHPTADWVYKTLKEEMPELSLGTVYRNLKVLTEQGRVRKLPFGSTFDRFDADTAPHYHCICEQCGSVEDFAVPLYLSDIDKKAEAVTSFKISHHRIDFYGLCKKCRKKTKQSIKQKERKNGFNQRNANRKKPSHGVCR